MLIDRGAKNGAVWKKDKARRFANSALYTSLCQRPNSARHTPFPLSPI